MTLLVIQTKFTEGAWAVIVAIPLLVLGFYGINAPLPADRPPAPRRRDRDRAAPQPTNTIVLYVDAFDEATRLANWYARQVADNDFHPIHVLGSSGRDLRGRWWDWSGGGTVIEALEREDSPADAVLDYVWQLPRGESSFVTVVVPEQFRRKSLLTAITRRTAFSLKLRLLREPGVVVTDVPLVGEGAAAAEAARLPRVRVRRARRLAPGRQLRADARDPGHAARSASPFDGAEAQRMRFEWAALGTDLPLEIDEAPLPRHRRPAASLLARRSPPTPTWSWP